MTNIENAAKKMAISYKESEVTMFNSQLGLPVREEVMDVLNDVKRLMFPAYFASKEATGDAVSFAQQLLSSIFFKIRKQIALALSFREKCDVSDRADAIANDFIAALPEIHRILLTDAQATFEGDPAASSKEEIIFSYPGFYAIFVYRVANLLYKSGVPFVPRMMTEYAHDKTGIDINPGATIGEYFFIDHGTGVVIGETSVIGKNVKIYQGVTLGALSPRKGQSLSGVKRHPTVCDNVTIYSGASILGGDTVIGEGAIIGGNTFITESVGEKSRVSTKKPELIIK
ncbi:MAG: serine acetyltransferase [Clostridia bacterium]|nr:serine acetyltransferase [Clostridia bacterium]MBQ9703405.1 serine acetyltransferase [Clostridia bacterium]